MQAGGSTNAMKFERGTAVWIRNPYGDRHTTDVDVDHINDDQPHPEEVYRSKWLSHKIHTPPKWVPGRVFEVDQGIVVVRTSLQPVLEVEIPYEDAIQWCGPNSVYQRSHLSTGELQATWSLDSLKVINPAEIMNALVTRYFLDLNYTFCGPVLVNINPYKHIADWPCEEKPDSVQWIAHSPEVQASYFAELRRVLHPSHTSSLDKFACDKEPHVYSIVNRAVTELKQTKFSVNQTIAALGVQGSGKTELIHHAIEYLGYISTQNRLEHGVVASVTPIETKIEHAMNLMEAFGNAVTADNFNSSRMGLFTRVFMTPSGVVAGCHMQQLWLESSRVTSKYATQSTRRVASSFKAGRTAAHPAPRQTLGCKRNFHIFYQILEGMPREVLDQLGLDRDREYHYLGRSSRDLDGMADETFVQDTILALETFGLQDQIERLFGMVATVIKIGNLQFQRVAANGQSSFLVRDEVAVAVASGVGMTLDELEACLCTQVTRSKNKGVDPTTACERRDALASAIYERVVMWLLKKINAVFESEALDDGIDAVESASHGPVPSAEDTELKQEWRCKTQRFIAFFDFLGFEGNGTLGSGGAANTNYFEKLLVNYAAEKLQWLMNQVRCLDYLERARESLRILTRADCCCSQFLFVRWKSMNKKTSFFQSSWISRTTHTSSLC